MLLLLIYAADSKHCLWQQCII